MSNNVDAVIKHLAILDCMPRTIETSSCPARVVLVYVGFAYTVQSEAKCHRQGAAYMLLESGYCPVR
jgi:hypothetical protein